MLDDFLYDEVQKLSGEIRVQISPVRQIFESCDLSGFAGRIGRGKVVLGLELADRLRVLEPLTQRIDEDRIKPIYAVAVLFEKFRGAGCNVSQGPSLSV